MPGAQDQMVEPTEPVRIGHWTAPGANTGTTVVLFPEGAVASGEVRGGAPATREFELLDPRRLVQCIDAVVLTGGSAFGLASADGVMRWLESNGRGFETRAGRVPIVVAMGLFDLGDGVPRPGPPEGVSACENAEPRWETGSVGAGAGATVAKWGGLVAKPGGLGAKTVTAATLDAELEVTALCVVNAVGDIDDGSIDRDRLVDDLLGSDPAAGEAAFENTTIGVVWTNARLTKLECRQVAEGAHDGLARALIPAHTASDGDAMVAVATGSVEAPVRIVRLLAAIAVEGAIRDCIGSQSLPE